MEPEVVQAVCGRHLLRHDPDNESNDPCIASVESLAMHADAVPLIFEQEKIADGTPTIQHLSKD